MVYTGPSKGCLACLKRRVKCDEAKPSCQRCRKAGRECPGYRDPARIKIRDMTATTINRFEYDKPNPRMEDVGFFDRSYSQSVMSLRTRLDEGVNCYRMSPPIDGDEQTGWRGNSSMVDQSNFNPGHTWPGFAAASFASQPLRSPPRTSTKQLAFAYFINHYIHIGSETLDPGYLDVLQLATQRRDMGHCLESCLSTLALAAFSRRPSCRDATIDTQAAYSVALKAVNDSIGNPGSIFDDELLASIMVLALVECLLSTKVEAYYTHLYGAVTILKSRHSRKFKDALGAELFMLLRYELIRTSAIRYVEPQDQYPCDWPLSAMEIVEDPCLAAAHAITAERRQGRLSTAFRTLLDRNLAQGQPGIRRDLLTIPSAFTTDAVLEKLMDEAPDLEETLKKYLEMVTSSFSVTNVPDHPAQDLVPIPWQAQYPNMVPAFPPQLQGYAWKTREHASLGLSLLTSQLYGYNVAVKVVEKARLRDLVIDSADYQALITQARRAVAVIVGSMPYLIGQGDSEGIGVHDYMWLHNLIPFVVALESTLVTMDQRGYIESVLEYAAGTKGVRMTWGILHHCRQYRQQNIPSWTD